ncbi:hypothetical protein JW935_24410 [candidate division KSB1 bacterium]|nr:hypothetical protein [candidate division KSB1 bacterium]
MRICNLFIFAIFFTTTLFPQSIPINPTLLEKTWQAQWIYHPTVSPTDYGVYHFRKQFTLDSLPDKFIIHVSADNRYRLFANGTPVCFGPTRGDILNWQFESVDIAPFLSAGKNILAAVVWNFGVHKPVVQLSIRTAFILQGDTNAESTVNTNRRWKVLHNTAYSPVPVDYTMVQGYYVAGPGDRVDGAAYPGGWEQPEFDDGNWDNAAAINNPGVSRGVYNYAGNSAWNLVPRNIPIMDESRQKISTVVRTDGISTGKNFPAGSYCRRIWKVFLYGTITKSSSEAE